MVHVCETQFESEASQAVDLGLETTQFQLALLVKRLYLGSQVRRIITDMQCMPAASYQIRSLRQRSHHLALWERTVEFIIDQ